MAGCCMPKVKIDNAREGMVTSKNVNNMDDMLLIPSGCELSARHLKLLRTWGVAEIEVEAGEEPDESQNPMAQLPPEEVAELQASLSAIFVRYDESLPIHKEVFRLALLRKIRQRLNVKAHVTNA